MAGRVFSARGAWTVGALWFGGALILYWLTGARGLVWADSSKLTLYAMEGYFPSLNPGDHAGWTVLAWVWLHVVGGDAVAAAHRLSGVAGALLVALAAVLVMTSSGDRARAHTAAALLMVAFPLWWSSDVAETYAPALAASVAGGLVLRQGVRWWRWWAAGGLWGLALAMHAMAIFLIVPLAWETVRARAWRVVPGATLGSAPVWLALLGGPRDPLTGFAASGSATWRWHWEAFLAYARAPHNTVALVALLLYALGALGLAALWRARREPRGGGVWAWSLGALALLLVGYAPYRLHLMVAFLLTGLVIAFPVRLPVRARVAHVAVQMITYLAVPTVLTLAGRQSLGVRVLPWRNNAFYFLCPVKGITFDPTPAVSTMAVARPGDSMATLTGWRRALDPGTGSYLASFGPCAAPGAIVLSDFNPGAVLRLAQVARGWRRDLDIRPVAVDVALGARNPVAALAAEVERSLAIHPVVLADTYAPYYHPYQLSARFGLHVCDGLVQVEGLRPASERLP